MVETGDSVVKGLFTEDLSSAHGGSSASPCTTSATSFFRVTSAVQAQTLTDGVELVSFDPITGLQRPAQHSDAVILPWLGFGTYRLGKEQQAIDAVRQALECGYRSIDTALVYGGETTERFVGRVLQEALSSGGPLSSRQQVFVTTKHWRNYHGYEPTLQCLKLSLERLQLDSLDLWLMHWPGPAGNSMDCQKEHIQNDSANDTVDMVSLRAETWRAMEEAVRRRQVRAIGVSNMTIRHLEELKKTAHMWPPAVNQVEFQYAQVLCLGFVLTAVVSLFSSMFCFALHLQQCVFAVLSSHKQSSWNIVERRELCCKRTPVLVVKIPERRYGPSCLVKCILHQQQQHQ